MREHQWSRAQVERGDDGLLNVVASTSGVKRDGLDLRASGWRTAVYESNPVVLWAHDASAPPIGRMENIDRGEQLRGGIRFDTDDPFAASIAGKYERGFLNAVSVRWDFVDSDGAPLEWWRLSAEQIRDEAFYELLEVSAVPVPADPDALVERARTGLRRVASELLRELPDPESKPTTGFLMNGDPTLTAPSITFTDTGSTYVTRSTTPDLVSEDRVREIVAEIIGAESATPADPPAAAAGTEQALRTLLAAVKPKEGTA